MRKITLYLIEHCFSNLKKDVFKKVRKSSCINFFKNFSNPHMFYFNTNLVLLYLKCISICLGIGSLRLHVGSIQNFMGCAVF
jgi:hypothetical protein